MTRNQTKALFFSAAILNWAAVLIFALLAEPLGIWPPPQQTLFGQIALLSIFLFGCGYWMVGRDPVAHRGLVVIGGLGKLGVVVIVLAHWLAGLATLKLVVLVSADLVYAVLFFLFLKRSSRSA